MPSQHGRTRRHVLAIGGAMLGALGSWVPVRAATQTRAAASVSTSVEVSTTGDGSAHARASASSSASSWSKWEPAPAHPLCFLQGTAISTPNGEVPVENLRQGDLVLVQGGRVSPIRCVREHRYTRPPKGTWHRHVHPILIHAHAIAPDVPRRDLYLSPGHALLIDGYLMRASDLVNGRSILFAVPDNLDTLVYRHIECDEHHVVSAEGAPAETLFNPTRHWQKAAPTIEYDGLYANILALARLASRSPWVDRLDPLQRAHGQIASRANIVAAA